MAQMENITHANIGDINAVQDARWFLRQPDTDHLWDLC